MTTEAVTATPRAAGVHRRARRGRGLLVLWVVTALVFAFLFVPIGVVIIYSFNSERSLGVFGGFSLRWYRTLFADSQATSALTVSVEIAAMTTIVATTLGTMLALGLARLRSRIGQVANVLMLLPLVTPEIVTGVALLILFTQLGQGLSLTTVLLGHITFSISYVTVVVRGRLALVNPAVEEAALDLGSTQAGALARVLLPTLRPAVLGSALLVFVLSFDDFVTSYFTSGNGTPPLPVVIYSMIKYGVTPEINAIGTLMLAVSVILFVIAAAVGVRAYRGLTSLGRTIDV